MAGVGVRPPVAWVWRHGLGGGSQQQQARGRGGAVAGPPLYISSLPAALAGAADLSILSLGETSFLKSSTLFCDSSYDFCRPSTSFSCASSLALMPALITSISARRSASGIAMYFSSSAFSSSEHLSSIAAEQPGPSVL